MCSTNLHHLLNLRVHRSLITSSSRSRIFSSISRSGFIVKSCHGSAISRRLQRSAVRPIAAMDDDFMDVSLGFDEVDEGSGVDSYYMMYSSGDESDIDVPVNPTGDYEVPLSKEHSAETPEGALNLTLHRFGAIQRGHRKRKRKFLVPLPPPYGIACLGKYYLVIAAFYFIAMGNGLNLTDGLDGLVGGVSALAFVGMSIAVLPICPDLAIFGASMAGACIGFLFHNRYKASILMGDVGSCALGGGLAAMAASTGMFIPRFISSGVLVLEVFSVIVQVLFLKTSPQRALPLHCHLKLWGLKAPVIVASAYVLSGILALFAGYVGLISA